MRRYYFSLTFHISVFIRILAVRTLCYETYYHIAPEHGPLSVGGSRKHKEGFSCICRRRLAGNTSGRRSHSHVGSDPYVRFASEHLRLEISFEKVQDTLCPLARRDGRKDELDRTERRGGNGRKRRIFRHEEPRSMRLLPHRGRNIQPDITIRDIQGKRRCRPQEPQRQEDNDRQLQS